MKYLFLIACIACGLSLTALSVIIATGRIPFASKSLQQESEAGVHPEKNEKLSGLPGQKEAVDDLRAALIKNKEEYEKKLMSLTAREQSLSNEQEVVRMLISEVESNRTFLASKIVESDASEQVNLKRLSAIYTKMDAESASTLMMTMDKERAAKILKLMPERQAGAILNAAIATPGGGGAKSANEWSDAIRRMKQESVKKGP